MTEDTTPPITGVLVFSVKNPFMFAASQISKFIYSSQIRIITVYVLTVCPDVFLIFNGFTSLVRNAFYKIEENKL